MRDCRTQKSNQVTSEGLPALATCLSQTLQAMSLSDRHRTNQDRSTHEYPRNHHEAAS
jgi:hypothetical protein